MKKYILLFLSCSVIMGYSQTCTTPASSQWKQVQLTSSLTAPVAMGIVPEDGTVFIAEMWSGKLKRYVPGQGVKTLKQLDVYIDHGRTSLGVSQPASRGIENGLLGVAVDSRYAEKKWIYLLYSRRINLRVNANVGDNNVHNHEHVLSRFTVSGDTLLSEKVILKIPRWTARHAGGGMDFNPRTGDLYIGTGDDRYPSDNRSKWGPRRDGANEAAYDALETSGNTNDLRGKVLRIRPIGFDDSETPEPGIGKTYKVPPGNLFEESKYQGADRFVRREIYTMGHRNPYHVRVDPYTGWAMVGDVGPDASSNSNEKGIRGHDEFNLITESGNFGWPFAVANNQAYKVFEGEASAYVRGSTFDLNNLVNESVRNTGLKILPPAKSALGWYTHDGKQTGSLANANLNKPFGSGGESAIGGPIYHYDTNLISNVKWPAYFNGKAIVGDYARGKIFVLELDGNKKLKKVEKLRDVSKIIDLDMGPKGELYVLVYGNTSGNLFKLEYNGPQYTPSTCTHYVGPREPDTVSAGTNSFKMKLQNQDFGIVMHANLKQNGLLAVPEGASKLTVYNIQGTEVSAVVGLGEQKYLKLPTHVQEEGVVFVQFE